jgi:PadR family transcriptional regulator, regulatory protein PadR
MPLVPPMPQLTEPAFLVLAALADEPRHGYGIVGEVSDLSRGRVRLRVGTLYGVLDRLAREGLLALDREEVHSGRLRRYYRLTGDGARVLQAHAEQQAHTARAAQQRLDARGRAGTPARAPRPAAGTA